MTCNNIEVKVCIYKYYTSQYTTVTNLTAMAPILYAIDASPPCRAVLLTAKALGITLQIETVNLFKKEQHEEGFLKINPAHTIPVLNDNGTIITDSHAIITYLVQKYGKDDSLYPKDLAQRTLINQRLFFDAGSLFPLLRQMVGPIFDKGAKTVPDEMKESVHGMYKIMETYLTGQKWIAGEFVTVADLSLVATITSADVLVQLSQTQYPNVSNWIIKCQSLPYYEENQRGLSELNVIFKKLMS